MNTDKCVGGKTMKNFIIIMTSAITSGIGLWNTTNPQEVEPVIIQQEAIVEETPNADPTSEDPTPIYQHDHNGDCANTDCPFYGEHDQNSARHEGNHNRGQGNRHQRNHQ